MTAHARLAQARSLLFVPGDRPERFAKALASGADAVIIDLELAHTLPGLAALMVPKAESGAALAALHRRFDGTLPPLPLIETAAGLGFGAKLCIHPGQVAGVHAALASTPEEAAWAERVVAASAAAGGAAVQLDGRMVDAPVLLQAQRVLLRARRVQGKWPMAAGAAATGSPGPSAPSRSSS